MGCEKVQKIRFIHFRFAWRVGMTNSILETSVYLYSSNFTLRHLHCLRVMASLSHETNHSEDFTLLQQLF